MDSVYTKKGTTRNEEFIEHVFCPRGLMNSRNKYYAEALYRLFDLEDKNCSCMKCQEERTKLEEFIKTQRDLISNIKIQNKIL